MTLKFKAIFRASATLALVAIIVGCAAGANPDDPNRTKRLADNKSIEAKYSGLTGTYHGTLTSLDPGSVPEAVDLKIYLVKEISGRDENNEPISVEVPKAALIRPYDVDPRVTARNLTVQFEESENSLIMDLDTSSAAKASTPIYFGIRAQVDGNTITGTAYDYRGPYAAIRVSK